MGKSARNHGTEVARFRGNATRLKVFSFTKAYMDKYNLCPNVNEVAEHVGISVPQAADHMHALNGADGLPCTIPKSLNGHRAKSGFSSLGLEQRTPPDVVAMMKGIGND